MPGCELAWCCDLDEANRARFAPQFPTRGSPTGSTTCSADDALDAIVDRDAGSSTHHPLGSRVLDAGKHLFVEKPLALTVEHAADLVALAGASDRQLMVGHLLRFHPAFAKVKELVDAGTLGRVLYLYTNRQNFGKVRPDENALWSLAPHDLSLALALAGERRARCRPAASATCSRAIEDVVFGFIRFPSGAIAHLHVSWLDPHKRRMLTVVGTEAMAVFDDTEADRKVTVYEKRACAGAVRDLGRVPGAAVGRHPHPADPGRRAAAARDARVRRGGPHRRDADRVGRRGARRGRGADALAALQRSRSS